MEKFSEYELIQNEEHLTEVEVDLETGEEVAEMIKQIVASDVATICMEHTSKMEHCLLDLDIPYERQQESIYVNRPTPAQAAELITEHCTYDLSSYILIFLFAECERKLEQVVFRKKPEWHVGNYLQEEGIVLTMFEDDAVFFIGATSEERVNAFVKIMDERMDKKQVPVIERLIDAPKQFDLPDDFLEEQKLPLNVHFKKGSGELLATPPLFKKSLEVEHLDKMVAEPIVAAILPGDCEDILEKLEIEYRTEMKMLITASIEAEKRFEFLDKLHKESILGNIYLFYGKEPKIQFERQERTSLLKKIFTPPAIVNFSLEEEAKALVLTFDGEIAAVFEG